MAFIEQVNAYVRTKVVPLQFEQLSLCQLAQSVREEFAEMLASRCIKWEQPDSMPLLRADRLSILRLLRNLVDNALKYGGPGLSVIEVEYMDMDHYHVLSVSDDGVGIRREDLKRIFSLFQRSENARGIEGMGLGLTIVKEIVEAHGGKVIVSPGRSKGVSFRCFLSKSL